MNRLILAFFFALLAINVTAGAASHEHRHHEQQTQQSPASPSGTGVLKAMNAKAGKVQIAHAPIDSLGWPAMTMWFVLRDPLPKDVMVGDNVRFELEQTQSKEWVVTRIERKR
jgi:Cu/Ag efflux protein CusF